MDMRNYQRLGSLKDLSYSDHDILTLRSGRESVVASRQELEQISMQLEEVMRGEALTAAQKELFALDEQLAEKERLIDAFIGHHERARESMRRALAAYEELPEQLVDPHTEIWVRSERRLFIDDHYVTSEAYLAALREQANRRREEAAASALATMDAEVVAHTENLKNETGDSLRGPSQEPGKSFDHAGAALGAAVGAAAGARVVAGARRAIFSGIAEQGHRSVANGNAAIAAAGVYRRPPASGPGSRQEPVNDPEALRHLDLYKTPLNPRMTSDGPIGGYLPAQVTDGTDPRWSSEAARSAVPSTRASMSAGLLGGAGGAVAAGSARSLINRGQTPDLSGRNSFGANPTLGAGRVPHGGVSTATGMSGLTGTASPTTSGGMPTATSSAATAASAARPFGAPGVAAGMGAPGASGGTHVSGTAAAGARPFGVPGAGLGTSAGGATAGMPGAPGAYAPGAAGASSDRKDGKTRIGYQVVRVRDDERRPINLSDGAGPGDSASMKPISLKDTDDSWE